MARLPDPTQGVIALDVGLRLGAQGQRVWRVHRGRARWFAVHQPVQQVEDMGLGRGAGLPSASSTAASTACSSCWRTRARISTISRSPPGFLSRLCCKDLKAAGSSAKGAPLRKAPGLRWMTAR